MKNNKSTTIDKEQKLVEDKERLMKLYRENALWTYVENYSWRVQKLLDIIESQEKEIKK